MPDWLIALILGVVEGLTEFIPVSSTGHLLLAEHWLKSQKTDLFNIVVQCGAVLAVLPLFSKRLRSFALEWRRRETRDYLLKLFAAFVITATAGFAMDQMHFKLRENPQPIAIALIVGGAAFLIVEGLLRGKELSDSITWSAAMAVALGQLVAGTCPGTSRSGATILLCLLLGISRPAATEFSFLVGIPTMLAAGGWKIFKALHSGQHGVACEDWGILLLATVVAALVSFAAVKWLLGYVQTHTFTLFGWYRIVLGGLILVLIG